MTIWKQGFSEILNGNFDNARNIFKGMECSDYWDGGVYDKKWWGDDDRINKRALKLFCEFYPLKKQQSSILLKAHENILSSVDDADVEILKKLLLLNDNNKLTLSGYFKLIESLSLKEQIRFLEIEYTETIFEKIPGASSESYVMSKYENLGYYCKHDEGGSIHYLMIFSLLNEIDALKKLLNKNIAARDNSHFEVSLNIGLFKDRLVDGILQFTETSKLALLDIYEKTTREKIINGYNVWTDAAKKVHEFSHVPDDKLEPVLKLFDALGISNFLTLSKFWLDNYDKIQGWPDIMAVKGNKILLIEVKRTDKLSFKQACTHSELKSISNNIFSGVHVEKVILR